MYHCTMYSAVHNYINTRRLLCIINTTINVTFIRRSYFKYGFRSSSNVYVNNFDARWHWIQSSFHVSNKRAFPSFMHIFIANVRITIHCCVCSGNVLVCWSWPHQCPHTEALPIEAAPQCSQCRNFRKRTVLIL